MKSLYLVGIAALVILAGCGKVGEVRNAVKAMSTAASAMEMAKVAGGEAIGSKVELTETSVRRYYGGIVKLREKHPGIEYDNAVRGSHAGGGGGQRPQEAGPRRHGHELRRLLCLFRRDPRCRLRGR